MYFVIQGLMKKITPVPISIRFDPEWLEEFDKWRTSQLVPLSRSAAIRVGIDMLMRAHAVRPGKKRDQEEK